MNLHQQLTAAAGQAADVVAGTSPEQFDLPTPCAKWDVRALLNHLVLWTSYSFERRARSEPVGEDLMDRDFAAEPDYAQAYRAQLDRALEAWAAPGVFDAPIDTGHATMPAAQIAEMILMEMVLHSWDLAQATGQEFACSDEVAQAVCKAVRDSAAMFRQYDGFADEVEASEDASPLALALAVSGRRPFERE
jgi:uncharacterized protein (TIGR03086 family)